MCSYGAAYWGDSVGDPLPDPSQFIQGSDGYKRQSHELRISSPSENRFRFVGGLFYQDQEHEIFQNYMVRDLAATFRAASSSRSSSPDGPIRSG